MRLTAPTTVMFLSSVALAVLALVSLLVPFPFVGAHRFLVMTGAWAVLMAGVTLKGV
jgi:TM2 domain-containing membrane protein YozV